MNPLRIFIIEYLLLYQTKQNLIKHSVFIIVPKLFDQSGSILQDHHYYLGFEKWKLQVHFSYNYSPYNKSLT